MITFNTSSTIRMVEDRETKCLGVIMPHSGQVLCEFEVNARIEKTRSHLRSLLNIQASRNTHGGKKYRAKQISLGNALDACNETISLLSTAKENIESYSHKDGNFKIKKNGIKSIDFIVSLNLNCTTVNLKRSCGWYIECSERNRVDKIFKAYTQSRTYLRKNHGKYSGDTLRELKEVGVLLFDNSIISSNLLNKLFKYLEDSVAKIETEHGREIALLSAFDACIQKPLENCPKTNLPIEEVIQEDQDLHP